MTRKLIFVVAAALGIVWSGVSEAKVCRLGDEGCETNEFFGTGDGQCDASYKPCDNPRAGATYCYGVLKENLITLCLYFIFCVILLLIREHLRYVYFWSLKQYHFWYSLFNILFSIYL